MKEKIKTIVNSKIFNYLFNILLVLGMFIIILVLTNTSPFGNNILGKSDAIVQYKPMLYNFIMGVKTGTWESFSFSNGLGNPFIFNFIYYLISPFNLVAILFNDADMMFLSVILIKMAVAALSMTFYAKKKGASNLVSTIATISYVFSGWFLAYWYNIMWLDTFALFPLFQYALDKLLKENKCLLYIFVMAFICITNFYQAFSLVIYNIVYFIIYNFFYKKDDIKDKLKTLLFYLGSSLIIVMLIYAYIYMLFIIKTKTGIDFSNVSDVSYTTSAMDFIKSIFYGVVTVTIEKSGPTFPNLCVNTITLLGSIIFFLNKKISVRDKIFAFIGLYLLISCVFFKEIDYVMNMFHNVNSFTFRYSYIMSFLMIVLFIKNADKFEVSKKNSFIILFILLVILGISYKQIDFDIFIFNLVVLLSCGILILFYSKNVMFKLIVLVMVIVQTLVLGMNNFLSEETIDFEGNKNNYSQKKEEYRIKSVTESDYLNQNLYYNKNVLYQYTPMNYNRVLEMVLSLGCSSGENTMICSRDDEFINMIFNVKNDYYLEKIYSVNEEILNAMINENNIKQSQEEVIEKMTGITNIFNKEVIVGEEKDDNIYFRTDNDFYLIDYIDENDFLVNYPQVYSEFYLEKELGINEVNIYTLNEDKLKEVYEYLSKNQIRYIDYSDSLMEGEIEVGENQIIFTSIPYDDAWHVYIDGVKVKTTKVLDDSLLAIECEPGKHRIKLEYKMDNRKPFIVSLPVFISLIIYIIVKEFKIKILQKVNS